MRLTPRVTLAASLLLVASNAASLGAVATSLQGGLEARLGEEVERAAHQAASAVARERAVLTAGAGALARTPLLQATLGTATLDAATLAGVAEEQRAILGAQLLLLLGPSGEVRAASPVTVEAALPGGGPLAAEARAPLLRLGGRAYLTVEAPVVVDGARVGAILVGRPLDAAFVQALARQSGAEVLLAVEGRPTEAYLRSVPAAALAAVPPGDGVRPLEVGGVPLVGARVPVGQHGALLLVRSRDEAFAAFRGTLLGLVGVGLASVTVAAAVLVLLLRRTLSRPLDELLRGCRRIIAGDLSEPVRLQREDEVGELAEALRHMLVRLRELPGALRQAATHLTESVGLLETLAGEQGEAVRRQATALQQARRIAEAIGEGSKEAVRAAQAILALTQRADQVGQAGAQTVAHSLAELTSMRAEVVEMGEQLRRLTTRTARIGTITEAVEALAEQLQLLALNAAIEAARAGEQGRGFGVVAREVRQLAERSKQATGEVRVILEEVDRAIQQTTSAAQSGVARIADGLLQVRASGESLQGLAALVRRSAEGVHGMATTVGRQDEGVAHIAHTVGALTVQADETVQRLERTQRAADALREVSQHITRVLEGFRL